MTAARTETDGAHRPAPRKPDLSVVPQPAAGERAQRLYVEAKKASLEHLAALQASLAETLTLTQSIVDAADLYAPGVAGFATRLAEELFWRAKSLQALTERQRSAAIR